MAGQVYYWLWVLRTCQKASWRHLESKEHQCWASTNQRWASVPWRWLDGIPAALADSEYSRDGERKGVGGRGTGRADCGEKQAQEGGGDSGRFCHWIPTFPPKTGSLTLVSVTIAAFANAGANEEALAVGFGGHRMPRFVFWYHCSSGHWGNQDWAVSHLEPVTRVYRPPTTMSLNCRALNQFD